MDSTAMDNNEYDMEKRTKKRALHLLELRDYTEKQLRDKLARGEYPRECIEAAIAYVKSFRYVDDHRYACRYVQNHQERMSKRQLWQKLLQKGISGETASEALEEMYDFDELVQIRQLLKKRGYEPTEQDSGEIMRTYRFLQRRGFSGSDIRKAMGMA